MLQQILSNDDFVWRMVGKRSVGDLEDGFFMETSVLRRFGVKYIFCQAKPALEKPNFQDRFQSIPSGTSFQVTIGSLQGFGQKSIDENVY